MAKAASDKLEDLARSLGFLETPHLKALRQKAVQAPSFAELLPSYAAYHAAGQRLADVKEGEIYVRAQIGLDIALARILLERGEVDRFVRAINDAISYANNQRLLAVRDALKQIRTSVQAEP